MIHSALKPFVMEDPAEVSKSMNYLGFLRHCRAADNEVVKGCWKKIAWSDINAGAEAP